MRSRLPGLSKSVARLAAAALAATVTGACGTTLLLPADTFPPSVGLSNSSLEAVVVGTPVGFVVTATFPGNPANVSVKQIHIEFGDGVWADLGAVPGTVSHPYVQSGVFVATATVTDTSGNQGRASLTVYVGAVVVPPTPPPSVGLTTTAPVPLLVGNAATFNVTASIPGNPAGVFIRNVHVDFGDGQAVDLGGASATVTHAYTAAGTYTVAATATDTTGGQGRASLSLLVSGPPKPAPPSVGVTYTVATTQLGLVYSFNVTASTPGNPPSTFIQNIRLDFGDGQSASLGASPSVVQHIYRAVGTYTATATATDNNGNEGKATITVVVPP